jgi:RNA recognition motif-containing protein
LGTKLLISNLPPSIDSITLENMFSIVGNVRAAVVTIDPETGISIGVGRVEMSTEEEAALGIDHYNGQNKNGHIIFVREDKPHVPNPNFVNPARKPKVPPKPKEQKTSKPRF